jgi:integrase
MHLVSGRFDFLGQLWTKYANWASVPGMAKPSRDDLLLPANAKVIAKAVKTASKIGRHIEYRISGVRGLVLHVLPSGTATWYFHYDLAVGRSRKRRKLKLGRLDDLPLANASQKAESLRPIVQQGADPARQRAEDRTALTFADLADERLSKGDVLRPGTLRDYEHLLGKDILPKIGDKPAKAIERDDVIALLDCICERGATRRADTARAVISSIFTFGIDRGLVQNNPASGLRNRHDNEPRDVVANVADIRTLWTSMDNGEAAMSPAVICITKLALLTGQRRTEITAVKRCQLDLNLSEPLLTTPRGLAKNRNEHRVPLSRQAAELLQEALDASEDETYVFPAERKGAHIAPRSVSKAMERTRAKLGIADITLHDLRRTAGTYLARFAVPKDIRERILNHGGKRKSSITDGVYNQYGYDAEKRAALELWADALDSIITDNPREIDSYHVRLASLNRGDKIKVG